MSKTILIIGGGISGLSLLHYLKCKYRGREDIGILLLEKNDRLGGTIHSMRKNGYLFEAGPNGFLDSKSTTLELIRELGLAQELLRANDEAKTRYICVRDNLYPVPASPKDFLTSPLLNPLDKLRVLAEVFVPRGGDPGENVYEFGKRRLGQKFADLFLDCLVKGIFGGDARRINLKAAFPRMYELENQYGSLFKAMAKLKKGRTANPNSTAGMPQGQLTSFRQGTGQLIEALGSRYQEAIHLNQDVRTISYEGERFVIHAGDASYRADELFLSTPAYQAASLLKNISPGIAAALEKIDYAPIAVVGLVFALSAFKTRPKGFGYLIPSTEQREVLGVLFDSNIFAGRCPSDQILFRVMMGGAQHREVLKMSDEELLAVAVRELKLRFSPSEECKDTFFVRWPRAIPQYDLNYPSVKENLMSQLKQRPHLHLAANYLNGISMNDCIENAYQSAHCIN